MRAAFFLAFCVAAAGCSGQATIPPSTTGAAAPAAQALGPAAAAPAAQGAVVATVPALQGMGISDQGLAPAHASLSLAVTLRYRNEAQLDRLIAQQTDARSSHFHRWLSNAEFNASFAPAQADYQRVIRSLRKAGFHIDTTYANRTVVDATASAGVVDRYFRTSVHRVRQGKNGERYLNTKPAYAPADLAGLLLSVDGLDTVIVVHTDHAMVTRRRSGAAPLAKSPLFGPLSSVTGYRGYGPLAFSAGYDLPVQHSAGGKKRYDGSGQASGIVIDADFAESDLTGFLKYFGITRTGPATERVSVHGGPPAKGDGSKDSVEAVLDSESLVGDAPGTALYVYEIPSLTNANVTDAFNKAVSDNVVDGLNSSFGGCESDVGTKTVKAWSALAKQGAAKGMTFHASTGDAGGSLCANAPANSPYVVGVGGTSLTVGTGGSWASEVGWSDSGGAISTVFPLPAWQRGVSGTVNRGRNLPDVALDANPYTGMALYFEGTWDTQYNPLGGTSLSSPLFGAAVAEIDQVKNSRVGLSAGALYGFLGAHGYGSGATTYFHDIVQGNNNVFYAGTGYDLVTGIGSIDGWNIAEQL